MFKMRRFSPSKTVKMPGKRHVHATFTPRERPAGITDVILTAFWVGEAWMKAR